MNPRRKGAIGLDGMRASTKRSRLQGSSRGKRAEELDRKRRMKWWHEARFGMFIHYGLYSLPARGECVMYWERIPVQEYAKLAGQFNTKPGAPREWAKLAKKAGMKYSVLGAKHGDGFCLWDSRQTDFNSVRLGPKRDLVREHVDACRQLGLRVGLYYNLNDWRHPDAARAAKSEVARRRYLDYVQGCLGELMSEYGKVDILWYDFPAPLETPEQWESRKMNAMVREVQPDIIINNRSKLPEDFGTPEGVIGRPEGDRAWESCMPMTREGIWGWRWEPERDWPDARRMIEWVRQATEGGGNLLLNVGPLPDGTVPDCMKKPLLEVGRWLKGNEEAVYGKVDPVERQVHFHPWLPYGKWTLKGKVGYFWCRHWPGKELTLVETRTRVKRISYLKTGKPVKFAWEPGKLVLTGLPEKDPDSLAHTTVFRIEFEKPPRRSPDTGLVWCGQ